VQDFHFTTISIPGESIYREKGSRFMAWALPVKSEAEVKQHLIDFRSQHPDAVHVCYAYLLKNGEGEGRSSDDGEPSGTAGKPILNQILSSGFEDVLVAVVRYYGGIKLGTGGLIQAYKTCAKDALLAAETITVELQKTMTVIFPFTLEGKMNSLVKKYKMEIGSREFSHQCQWELFIPLSVFQEVDKELKSVHGLELL
jgi:uncharacterized YigZ family protein